jgi:hypothetical protein
MLVHLAATKKVVMLHAADEQENHDREEHYEQELCQSKPRWILFFLISLVAICCHALFSLEPIA